MKPTVEEAKAHLRIDSADEDDLISGLIDAAYLHAGNHLRRDLAVEYPAELPAPIMVAIMLHVGALFHNREAVAKDELAEVPFGARLLLESYRTFPVS